MPRSSLAALLLVVVVGGCASPSKEFVFVDMAQVRAAMPGEVYPPDRGPTKADPIHGPTVQIPGLPETSLKGSAGVGEGDARSMLETNRKRAQGQLEERLRTVYYEELARQQEAALDEIDPSMAGPMQEARARQRSVFETYARERGQRMARIALLAGFPDPDPNGTAREPVNPFRKTRREEADRLREEIKALDKQYDRDVIAMFRELDASRDKTLTDIRFKFTQARVLANARAKKEAETEMAALREEFGAVLNAPRELRLPAAPGKTLVAPTPTLGGGSALAPPKPNPEVVERQLREQIDIWRAVKGYREAKSVREGRDGTDEFLTWRKSRRLGP